MKKLFRFTTTIPSKPSMSFTDWYEADTLETARELYDRDTARYGLPASVVTEITECNPVTLKPLENLRP